MRHLVLFTLLIGVVSLPACKKTIPDPPSPPPYLSTTAGNTWEYRQTDVTTTSSTDYTLTATNRDTLVGTRSYRIFTNSRGGANAYFAQNGNDYYTFRTLGIALGNSAVENLYLKENAPAGTTWSESLSLTVPGVPFAIPVTVSYRIEEIGLTRTVNGTPYADVIRVKTTLSSSLIPPSGLTTDIEDFYARRVGAIESKVIINIAFMGVNQSTNTRTILLRATLL